MVLHSKDLCIGCGYCFYACPFGAPQYPRVGNFGIARQDGQVHLLRRRARRRTASTAEYVKYGSNRLAEGKLPLCAEMCSTKALLAGDGEIIAADLQGARREARLRLGRLGLEDGLSRDGGDLITNAAKHASVP